jgi:hypothetical protein
MVGEISRSPLPTIWLGPAFAVRIRRLRDCVITNVGALSPIIYNCRTKQAYAFERQSGIDNVRVSPHTLRRTS